MSVIVTKTKLELVTAKFVFRLDVWFVNEALGKWLGKITTLKLSVVVVPKVFVNVIVESNVWPLCLA